VSLSSPPWRRLENWSWLLAATMAVAGAARMSLAPQPSGAVAAQGGQGPLDPVSVAPDSLQAWRTRAIEADPFRIERTPAKVAYRPEAENTMPPPAPPPAPPKPVLVLTGIVGGPPWEAVIEGLPGREGSVVVRAGQVVAGLSVKEISSAGAVVQGADTVWHLTVRRPWR